MPFVRHNHLQILEILIAFFCRLSDLCHNVLTITPDSGHWRGATFEFSLDVPDEYPMKPPRVLCKTPVYHPNIDVEGKVCLNILRDDWKPVLTINNIIYGMIFLFTDPNPNDPLNKEAAQVMRDSPEQFSRNVAQSLQGGTVDGRKYPKMR